MWFDKYKVLRFKARGPFHLQRKVYLIPIKICAPLIFAHLTCTEIKGSKFAQYEWVHEN